MTAQKAAIKSDIEASVIAKPVVKKAVAVKPAEAAMAAPVVVKAKIVKKPVIKTPAVKAPVVKTAATKIATPAALKKPLAVAVKPALKPVASAKAAKKVEPKLKKIKQVRDSFTMPETEYEVLGQVKKACLKAGFEIKKSDLLRIGVSLIKNLESGKLKTLLAGLTPLKVGRPKK